VTDPRPEPDTPASPADPAPEPAAEAIEPDGGVDVPDESGVDDIEAIAASDPRSKAELLTELITAEHKRDEYLDDLRRSHADFENYRRRVMRDGAAQREAGKADVAGGLLDVLDDLDRTLQAASGSDDTDLAKGIELVASKLVHALTESGLSRIDEVGVTFDPNVHEAVSQQPAEEPVEEPVVAEVFRPGYRLGDRVLRAAMVVVAQ
jgi:molecular chaperone GrpE